MYWSSVSQPRELRRVWNHSNIKKKQSLTLSAQVNHQCRSSTWYLKILQPPQHDSNWASLLETKMRLRVVYVGYPRERRANTKTETKSGEPGYRKNYRTYRIWAPGGLATADAERVEREESESDCGYLISIPAAIWRFWIDLTIVYWG